MNPIVSRSLSDLDEVASQVLKEAKDVRVIALTGNLGAGKTTLVSEMIKALDAGDFAGSPTFSLVNEYSLKDNTAIYHFDFYRIKDEGEVLDIGWEDYITKPGAWVFIEWPQRIENLMPEHFLHVNILQEDSIRTFERKMF